MNYSIIKPIDIIKVSQEINFIWGGDKNQTLDELKESIADCERRQRTTELKEIIILSNQDFDYFKDHLIDYYGFLKNMYYKYITRYTETLGYVVFNIDTQNMIGIDTQGYDYARYATLVKEDDQVAIKAIVTAFYNRIEIQNQDNFDLLVSRLQTVLHDVTSDDIHRELPNKSLWDLIRLQTDKYFEKEIAIEYLNKFDPDFSESLEILKNDILRGRNINNFTLNELAKFHYSRTLEDKLKPIEDNIDYLLETIV